MERNMSWLEIGKKLTTNKWKTQGSTAIWRAGFSFAPEFRTNFSEWAWRFLWFSITNQYHAKSPTTSNYHTNTGQWPVMPSRYNSWETVLPLSSMRWYKNFNFSTSIRKTYTSDKLVLVLLKSQTKSKGTDNSNDTNTPRIWYCGPGCLKIYCLNPHPPLSSSLKKISPQISIGQSQGDQEQSLKYWWIIEWHNWGSSSIRYVQIPGKNPE
jgi:hypothetical protein